MRVLIVLPAARGVYPEEAAQRRIDRCKAYARPGLEIDVDYPNQKSGFQPFGGEGSAPDMARNHQIMAERLVQGAQEGYDACIPFGMIDFGVEIARAQVEIPIIGQSQATYAMASMMANRVGVISYQTRNRANQFQQMQAYGFLHMLVGFGASGIPNNEMPARREELFRNFVREGKRLVDDGAELIVCHGMSMSPIEYSAQEYADAIGVPVLEGMECALAMAQAWVFTGKPYSRIRHAPYKPG
jgi:Asp/Glu/hydantoin racemase